MVLKVFESLKFYCMLNMQAVHTTRQGWLVGFLGFNGSNSVYIGSSPKRGRKRRERIDERKNVQTTPTRTYCKCSRPLPYCNPNCRTPRHWKFTQHHGTTRPPPLDKVRVYNVYKDYPTIYAPSAMNNSRDFHLLQINYTHLII